VIHRVVVDEGGQVHQLDHGRQGQRVGRVAVVDDELRVRGLRALRVIDASIMPRITSGNTNAPVYVIAEKGAEMMRAAAR